MVHICATRHFELRNRPKKTASAHLDRRSVHQFEALLSGYNIERWDVDEAQAGARRSLLRQRCLAEVFFTR